MLVTRETWELKNSQIGILYAAEDRRYYPFCEVRGSVDLFHVEMQRKGQKRLWSRFIVSDILDLIPLIRDARKEGLRINLQTRSDKSTNDYDIISVVEIAEGTDPAGQRTVAYRCANGRGYIRSISGGSESDFVLQRIIYRRDKAA